MQAQVIRSWIQLTTWAFFFFTIDLFTKDLLFGIDRFLIGSFFRLERHENVGLSFNIPMPLFIPIVVAIVVLIGVISYGRREIQEWRAITIIAIGLFVGGVLGNLYDRVMFGYVRDWIAIYRSIFNLADVFILGGLILFIMNQTPPVIAERKK